MSNWLLMLLLEREASKLLKSSDAVLLLALLALSRRTISSSPRGSWSPMGPFPAWNTLPAQPQIPPNPLEKK